MGYVYADITLANATDAGMARRGKLKDKDVRQMTVSALVDSGAYLPDHQRNNQESTRFRCF